MGSRITRSIYRSQRSSQPTESSIITAIRFFCLFLCLLLAFSIGYAHQIDRILLSIESPNYKPDKTFDYVQIALVLVASIGIGLTLSLFNFTVLILKCAFACALSQLLVYWSFGKLGLPALYIGEVLFDVNAIGVMISIFMLIKLRCQPHHQTLWITLALAFLDVGLHWSYFLTPLAHNNNSIQSVYVLSSIFLILSALAAFLIVVLQGRLFSPKSYFIHPKNCNMESVKFMFEVRLKEFGKVVFRRLAMTFLAGFTMGVGEVAIREYEVGHFYSNGIVWVLLVALFWFMGELNDNVRWAVQVALLVLLGVAGMLSGGESQNMVILVMMHFTRVCNFTSMSWRINPVYYALTIGVYLAANYLGTFTKTMFSDAPNFPFLSVLATITQIFADYYRQKHNSASAEPSQQQQIAVLNS